MGPSTISRPRKRPRAPHVLAVALLALAALVGGTLLLRQGPPAALPTSLTEEAAKAELDAFAALDGAALGELPASGSGEALPALRDDEAPPAPGQAAQGRVDDALIVRTAYLELEVEDVTAALRTGRGEVVGLGGYVAGSDEVDQGETRWASVTYRVPVARFADAIDALRGLADRVVRESTQSDEVTATVVDLDARIANLEASESALVEIMDRSGRIEDVLAVQSRLETVRGQIEQLEAQRANLADQAALSTISVTWSVPLVAVAVAQQSWSLATEVDAALAQTVEALQSLASLGIWVAVVLVPLLGVPLLIVGLFLVLLRRRLGGDAGDGPRAATAAGGE